MHFSFVILHYGLADVTMSAVDSVMQLEKKESEISVVVVDNASPGGTGTLVQEKIRSLPNVYFLASEKNIGFAKGNNIGFVFAKQKLEADFIILMNNDAVVETIDFCTKVLEDYQREHYAVLGPRIRTPSGNSQNPLRKKMLKGMRLRLTRIYLWIDLVLTWLFIAPILSKVVVAKTAAKLKEIENAMNNVELHGSFLIFSPLYIEKFDGLDDRTFMYCEEEFLFARCVANGLKSRYNPEIKVYHNEIENRNSPIKKVRAKRLFRIRNCIKSLDVYAKVIMKTTL